MSIAIPAGAPKSPTSVGRPELIESAATFHLVPPVPEDKERWRHLYRQFAEHYTVPVREEHQDLVWSWVMDPEHPLHCLLAKDDAGVAWGLAHYRAFTRPLAGSVGCFLDDLLVDAEARGTGVADALLFGLRQMALDNGWTVVRWITADDNHRARGVYDKFAVRTMWVTYDMAPGDLPDELKEVLA
jgi:GNAT superfamily N-acetyltransferase